MSDNEHTTVRIVDIARMAGVSVATVDRVIHNRGKVSEENLARINEVLRRVDYRPNLIARSLASGRRYTLCAVMPRFAPGEYWADFEAGIARAEAEAAFGDGECYMEKFVSPAHHVEVQVMADKFGNVFSLGERECSVQRRHQKIIEESPSPLMTAELRERMGRDAVAAARAVGYLGAGTVEFLVDRERNYYFLEMNTRLQVEHPITEEVCGVDLVKEQIFVADGRPLRLTQRDIVQRGHAIECRICAEDASAGFMPSPGVISQLTEPGGIGVRLDSYVYEKYEIPVHYDPMIGKLIVWATTREFAVERMRRALDEYKITGVKTNIAYLGSILELPELVGGDYNTSVLEKNADRLALQQERGDREEIENMAMITALINYMVSLEEGGAGSPAGAALSGFTSRWREFGKRNGVKGI